MRLTFDYDFNFKKGDSHPKCHDLDGFKEKARAIIHGGCSEPWTAIKIVRLWFSFMDSDFNNEAYKVLCLSKRGNSNSMWSYYANNHKGVVIVFDEEKLTESLLQNIGGVDRRELGPFAVEYKDKAISTNMKWPLYTFLKSFHYGLSMNIQEIVRQVMVITYINDVNIMLRTKHTDWEHEKEFRYVIKYNVPEQDPDDISFNSSCVKAINFGLHVSECDIQRIKRLCSKLSTDFYQVIKSEARGELSIEFKPV